MDKAIISQHRKSFEQAAFVEEGIECWLARDLQELLDYKEWRNFQKVIEKAKIACQKSEQKVEDHFVDVNKMVLVGSDTHRDIDDIILTRYACYLIAQNGDPKKVPIAFAQTYFAFQTRKQEILEERLALNERLEARKKLTSTETELSKNIYEKGVDNTGFGRIRSKGDRALFGGNSTKEMKRKLSIPENRPLADFLPTVTIKAKDLATEITNFNVKKNELHGEEQITIEHVKNNTDVRSLLTDRGIIPEEIPPEEDLKKLERRVKSDEKKIAQEAKQLKQKD
ncbi:MAG: DNA-damage-inducible protein D [Chlamydiales bacterium]|jgi:DNA-damage-inducible protein D